MVVNRFGNVQETGNSDWQPACSHRVLRTRAILLRAVRNFFEAKGYLEVETPILSHDVVVDAHLQPFGVDVNGEQYFLQTSPEAGMKRLLASGIGSIYQITRSFRSGERGARHNPEFTMVEWYGVGTDHHDQMELTEELITWCMDSLETNEGIYEEGRFQFNCPFDRMTYDEAFRAKLGESVLDAEVCRIIELAKQIGVTFAADDAALSLDDVLNLVLAEKIEPCLGRSRPAFLTNYPISQAALSRRSSIDTRTAERFELYVGGIELCNGYHELTDTAELVDRDNASNFVRLKNNAEALPGAVRMMQAMTAGMPACSGVALGFDRLVMLAVGANSIDDVLAFPFERA